MAGLGGLAFVPGGYTDAGLKQQQLEQMQLDQDAMAAFGRGLQLMGIPGGQAMPGAPGAGAGPSGGQNFLTQFLQRPMTPLPQAGGGMPPAQPGVAPGVPAPAFPGAAPMPGATPMVPGSPSPGVAMGGPAAVPPAPPGPPVAPGGPVMAGPAPAQQPAAGGPNAGPDAGGGALDGSLMRIINAIKQANPGADPRVLAAAVTKAMPLMNVQAQAQWKQFNLALQQGRLDESTRSHEAIEDIRRGSAADTAAHREREDELRANNLAIRERALQEKQVEFDRRQTETERANVEREAQRQRDTEARNWRAQLSADTRTAERSMTLTARKEIADMIEGRKDARTELSNKTKTEIAKLSAQARQELQDRIAQAAMDRLEVQEAGRSERQRVAEGGKGDRQSTAEAGRDARAAATEAGRQSRAELSASTQKELRGLSTDTQREIAKMRDDRAAANEQGRNERAGQAEAGRGVRQAESMAGQNYRAQLSAGARKEIAGMSAAAKKELFEDAEAGRNERAQNAEAGRDARAAAGLAERGRQFDQRENRQERALSSLMQDRETRQATKMEAAKRQAQSLDRRADEKAHDQALKAYETEVRTFDRYMRDRISNATNLDPKSKEGQELRALMDSNFRERMKEIQDMRSGKSAPQSPSGGGRVSEGFDAAYGKGRAMTAQDKSDFADYIKKNPGKKAEALQKLKDAGYDTGGL